MNGSAKPLMFGYLRVHRLAPEVTREAIAARFDEFASIEGYSLAGVFVDQARTAPAALGALIDAVKQYDARAVAVPTLDHLAVLGADPPLVAFVQNATGAQVMAMDSQPNEPS